MYVIYSLVRNVKVLIICQCGTLGWRRQGAIGLRVSHSLLVLDVTFLPGALSPVTASNGGAGGVFLDGTG